MDLFWNLLLANWYLSEEEHAVTSSEQPSNEADEIVFDAVDVTICLFWNKE